MSYTGAMLEKPHLTAREEEWLQEEERDEIN